MKILSFFLFCAAASAQAFIGTGASFNYANKQSSSLSSFSTPITSIGGLPTYSTTSLEFSFVKQPDGTIGSTSLSVKTGISQLLWHSANDHFGILISTDAGIFHFDAATLMTTTGSVGLYWDIAGTFTHDKYHAFLAPLAREVSIASQQVKPVFGIQFLVRH